MVYIEFGLSIPRYRDEDGTKRAVPRSGGEKNYVSTLRVDSHTVSNCFVSWNTCTGPPGTLQRVSTGYSS